jgi:hypothetical protein
MTWLSQRVIDLANSLYDLYYTRKYRTISRHLGMGSSPQASARQGFVILQIDALCHRDLLIAMERGYMPYLTRLYDRGEMKLRRWRCGVPSTTPAVQAGLMFGNNYDIPSFRWYDKRTRQPILCQMPQHAQAIQQRVSAGRPGILEGGSSYMSIMDGDARLSLLTVSAFNRHHFFESVRGIGLLLLFFLNPLRVIRLHALSLWEYLRDAGLSIWRLLREGKLPRPQPLYSLTQVAINIGFREIQTFACMLDIYRGVPAIYTNYYGYDEVAHHFGPTSQEALRILKGIDAQIRQIDQMRRKYQRRNYDLYVLSDHGMTPSQSFHEAFGCSLADFIAQHTGREVWDERPGEPGRRTSAAQTRVILEELESIEANLSPRGATMVRAARRYLAARMPSLWPEDWDLSRRRDIVVRNSGSLAHVYFNVTPRSMELSEIALLYPKLLPRLVQQPGIGLVIGREGDDVVVMGPRGELILSERAEIRGEDPLATLADRPLAADELRQMARFPHSGDLILFGAWDPHPPQQVITFEDQVASHGGLGGEQLYPFILYAPVLGDACPENGGHHQELDPDQLTNPCRLYSFFRQTYH